MASRQRASASASATSNAPVTTRRSPPATPMSTARTPASRGPVEHARRPRRGRPRARPATRTRRSTTPRWRSPASGVTVNPVPPANRHLGERHGEPAVGAVVHAGDDAVDDEPRDEVVHAARGVEIGRRRQPAVEPVHHRGPFGPTELRLRLRTDEHEAVAVAQGRRRRHRLELLDQADHTDDWGGVDVATARLVVEADVAADDREVERHARLAHPVDHLRELPHHLGVLGVAEVQAVHERAWCSRPRTRRCAPLRAPRADRRYAGRGGRSAPLPSVTSASARGVPFSRSTVASPPGPTTVLRKSWWSYWRHTHDLSAMVGRGQQREQLAGEVGAVGEALEQRGCGVGRL